MIRRSLSVWLGSTALAVLLAGAAGAQEANAPGSRPAETAATSPAPSEVADRAEPAAPVAMPAGGAGAIADPAALPAQAEAASTAGFEKLLAQPLAMPEAPPPFAPVADAPARAPAPAAAVELAPAALIPLAMPTEAPAFPAGAQPPRELAKTGPAAAPAAEADRTVATGAIATTTTAPAATPKSAPAAAPASLANAEPVPAAAPVVAVPMPVAGIAEAEIAAAIATALAEPVDRKAGAERQRWRAAVTAFYVARAHAPLFVAGSGLSTGGKAALDRFERAGEDGLDQTDYAVTAPAADATAEDLASAELAIAEAALRYASHAMAGRFDPRRVSALVTAEPPKMDPAEVLADLGKAADVSAALEAYNPPHEGYRRLKAKLAEMAPAEDEPRQVQVPAGPSLKPGQKDARVATLRERLGVGATISDAELYDDSLVDAVKAFQRDRGIKATGVVGPLTIGALNKVEGRVKLDAADIVANMERWRWLPRDLGSMHVMVNIPEFQLTINQDGKEIHRTRVIVGKVQNQTPVFSHTMTHIIVNPYWNVPVSILKKEMLGKIQETGGAYLERGNYEVVVGSKVLSAAAVDWTTVNPAAVRVRQRPGAGNALGNVKFMFPNEHAVYLHDTSSRGLFSQSYRALSHGCVRVHEPFAFADALLSEEPTKIDGAKLKATIGGGERYFWLKRKIDVHLAYFTAFVAEDGNLVARPDIYGHNKTTKRLLGL